MFLGYPPQYLICTCCFCLGILVSMNGNGSGLVDVMEMHESELSGESSKIEQEALERKIKLGKASEHISNLIDNCKYTGAKSLDLTKKNLLDIPNELLTLDHLEVSSSCFYLVVLKS